MRLENYGVLLYGWGVMFYRRSFGVMRANEVQWEGVRCCHERNDLFWRCTWLNNFGGFVGVLFGRIVGEGADSCSSQR